METAAAADDHVANPPTLPPWSLCSDAQRRRLLIVLFLIATTNYLDRHIMGVLLEPIKREFQVSDAMLGLLGGATFALFYSTLGLPIARWADRGNRRTIVTLGLTVCSLMTATCGLAQSYLQLALARVGVGAGEGGAVATAQSLVADYFPPERRAAALGIFMSAATAGYLLGFGGGGYLAAEYGWRTAFLAAGLPGLLLAIVARLSLLEPRLTLGFPRPGIDTESLRTTASVLLGKRSFRHVVTGCTLYFLMAYGVLIFMPSYFARVLQVPLRDISLVYGSASAVASLLGALGGGWLAGRMQRRDLRWQAWLPAIACMTAAPLFILSLQAARFDVSVAMMFLVHLLLSAGLPPAFAVIHAICGSRRRATAIALVFFFASLLGNGLGPVLSGLLSDLLTERYGVIGLGRAMQILTISLFASGVAFLVLARTLRQDLED